MGFFPELKDEETHTDEIPSVLLAMQDGWVVGEDIEILERIEDYGLSDEEHEKIYDFISEGNAGDFMVTEVGILVILSTAVPKSN